MFSFNQIIIGIALLVLLGCELWALRKSVRGRSRNAFLLLNLSFALVLSGYLWLFLSLLSLLWQVKRNLVLVQKDIFGGLSFYFADRSEFFLIFLLAGAVFSIINLERTFP